MSKDIIIYQPWGGLGDNLAFSTLPKLYSELGYNVYISNKNVYRNPEIYDLVWKLNPYIKGISDLPPNAGSCKEVKVFCEDESIKNVEIAHGLHNGKANCPEIYYTPNNIPDLNNTLVYDITSITAQYSDEFILSTFTSVFKKYPELKRKIVKFKSIKNRELSLFKDEIIEINNIFEYCDIISSCNVYVSLMSGGSVLASAVKKNNIYPIIYTFHHTKVSKGCCYNFGNIHFNHTPIS
jgi:hypothetical protein